MDTFDAINQRRSVKAYDPTHRLTAAEETNLLEAAIQSPTSFNMQNWRFVIAKKGTRLFKRLGSTLEISVSDCPTGTQFRANFRPAGTFADLHA